MTADKNSILPISEDMGQIILDSQKLTMHLAKSGNVELEPRVTAILVMAKKSLADKEWTVQEENEFLVTYDKLATLAHPVNIDSLNAIFPQGSNKKGRLVSDADKAVSWYRRYTMVTLVILLVCQVYWLVGHDLRTNLQSLFEERQQTQSLIDQGKDSEPGEPLLAVQLQVQNQKLDANYKLLMLWNQIWLLGGAFDDAMPKYFQAKFEQEKRYLERDKIANAQLLDKLHLEKNLHQVRMVLFEYILAADFILESFQAYFLPLLYGLFGAFIYVLRNLMREIKQRTYSHDSEVKFRLRLTLGALGGMIIGWFFQPDEASGLASLSPMALAFLMGYNIELLFSVMDRVIENIRSAVEAPAKEPAKSIPATQGK
jgi:hypothetical protein